MEIVNIAVNSNFADVTFADEKDLDAVSSRLNDAGLSHHTTQILDAVNVAAEILRISGEIDAELIVVGLRRRSPMGMALLGSNAQQIILSATCPVVSVRPAPTADRESGE